MNLLPLLLLLGLAGSLAQEGIPVKEYPSPDGWYHNLAHGEWGGADMHLSRRADPAYSDGVYEPSGKTRPNPRILSQALQAGRTGMGSFLNRTALITFYGQQVVEEILDAQRNSCPPEYFNIPIPKGDPLYDPDSTGHVEIPFVRTRYDHNTGYNPNQPREQLNEITPWLDGGLVYGTTKAWTDALRTFEKGTLAGSIKYPVHAVTKEDPYLEGNTFTHVLDFPQENTIGLPMANPPPPARHKLENSKRFFKLGNPRGNENSFLLTFGILWYREHNFHARRLAAAHPDWDDDTIFNEARLWTIAMHQHVTVEEWLPSYIGRNPPAYEGYKSTTYPGITHVFQSAAMRFGHTLVPPGVFRRNATCSFYTTTTSSGVAPGRAGHLGVRTCNSFFEPQPAVVEHDIDAILMGLASQITEREDHIVTEDLRGFVFGPLEFSRRDLMAINIQRGRDHGLPDYNSVRATFDLPRVTNYSQITINQTLADRLAELYGDINNIDVWVGGILESEAAQGPGELFAKVIEDQFVRIRDGDRWWYANKLNGAFSDDEIAMIHNTSLYDIIIRNTQIPEGAIQKDVFHHYSGDPCPQPYQISQFDMEPCTPPKFYDYFQSSEAHIPAIVACLGIYAMLVVMSMFLAVYLRKKLKLKKVFAQRKGTFLDIPSNLEGKHFAVLDWYSSSLKKRPIIISITETHLKFLVGNSTDRSIPRSDVVKIFLAVREEDKELVLLQVRKEYDALLQFKNKNEKQEFLKILQQKGEIPSEPKPKLRNLLTTMKTKKMRKMELDRFFRMALLQKEPLHNSDILNIELSKAELADSLGMNINSLFLNSLWNNLAQTHPDSIKFREFFDMMSIFISGSFEDKMEFLFHLYDLNGDGKVDRDDMSRVIKSMADMTNAVNIPSTLSDQLSTVFQEHGIQGSTLSKDQFAAVFQSQRNLLEFASWTINTPSPKPDRKVNFNETADKKKTPRKLKKNAPDYAPSKRDLKKTKTLKDLKPQAPAKLTPLEALRRQLKQYRRHIIILFLYMIAVIGIFCERAYYYSVEREHAGLRRIAGYGVTITRGAASVQMFTYSTLLLTMSRNTITFLRNTPLGDLIPFDSAYTFHKIVAWIALTFTVMHITGHTINFYHITTQPVSDLNCLFREVYWYSNELPTFSSWLFTTMTGMSGFLCTVVVVIIYAYAQPYTRRKFYAAFHTTHYLYILYYILMIVHGNAQLVQQPIFQNYFYGPVIVFTLDRLYSLNRRSKKLRIKAIEVLPSDVTLIVIDKPKGLHYQSGQWMRFQISDIDISYHPFTISSSPHENELTFHIRAVGPWTRKLRKIGQKRLDATEELPWGGTPELPPLPYIRLDGPYGETHQEWYKYEYIIMVGSGVGVTPFSSILKDLVHGSARGVTETKKAYFFWICRTQKHFEWMIDLLRELEEKDVNNILEVHIFVTQLQSKFDMRTTMLYVCERQFQKINDRSLFTGLISTTHFGRPIFEEIFALIQKEHNTSRIGVFSCGSPSVTSSVTAGCDAVNRLVGPRFIHKSENF